MPAMRRGAANLNTLSWWGRLSLFAALLALAAAAWYVLLMAPLDRHRRSLEAEAAHKESQIAALERRAAGGQRGRRPSSAPDERARIAALKFDIDKLDHRIKQVRDRMIGPGRMRRVLRSILARNDRLHLISIENLAPKPLFNGSAKESGGHDVQAVFMHGLRIRFTGQYLDTLRYVKDLEALPWRLVWGGLDYDVRDYPEAEGTLVVYTLSTEAAWI